MKINNDYAKFLQTLKKTENKTKSKTTNKDNEPKVHQSANNSVEINISKEARELAELSGKEAHQERIENIKMAIEKSQYEIDPKGIAEGISRTIMNQKGLGE